MQQDRKRQFILGGILIVLGIFFLLQNYRINISDWFILGVGILFINAYFTKKRNGFLIAGLILTYLGGVIFLNNINIIPRETFGSLILVALGLSFLTVYFLKRLKSFIFPGFILPAVGIYIFVIGLEAINRSEIWPLIFMNLALAFLLIFIFEFKTYGYKLLIPSFIFFVIGLLSFMTVQGVINISIWDSLFILIKNWWPAILIIIGIIIVLKNSFIRRD